jgi:hypothetical protein
MPMYVKCGTTTNRKEKTKKTVYRNENGDMSLNLSQDWTLSSSSSSRIFLLFTKTLTGMISIEYNFGESI